MAVQTAYVIQADSYSAQNFRNAINSLLPVAVGGLTDAVGGVVNYGELAVSAGSGNSVNVAAGECWVGATEGSAQGLYYCYNDATVNLSITPNGSNPLIAIVTMSVNDQAYSGNPGVPNNTAGLLVTQGTPSGSPAQPATPNNSLLLATILVPAGASSSSSYTITDTRVSSSANPAARMYASGSGTSISNNTNTAVTSMVKDFAVGSMTFSASTLIIPVKGIYRVNWYVSFAALSATGMIAGTVRHNSDFVLEARNYGGDTSNEYGAGSSDLLSCDVGDTLALGANQITGATQGTIIGTQYTYLSASLDQPLP